MATLYAKQLAAEGDELLAELDSMSEMGEIESRACKWRWIG